MFKNIFIYRINQEWASSASQVEAQLHDHCFIECRASQEKSLGWIAPRGHENGALLESVAGQWILQMMLETRSVPASVVKRKLTQRVKQIESAGVRKLGKKEIRDLKEDLRMELLPLAFTKQSSLLVWLDRATQLLILDTPSQARADAAVTLLVQSLPGLALQAQATQIAPRSAMADWLLNLTAPAGFSVDRDCELKAADESRALVRYARHRLDTDEVQRHVREGKQPSRLAMSWQGRVSFVLTETLQLKQLSFLDVVFAASSHPSEDDFDADVALSTGELRTLVADMLAALGGALLPN